MLSFTSRPPSTAAPIKGNLLIAVLATFLTTEPALLAPSATTFAPDLTLSIAPPAAFLIPEPTF